MLKAAETYTHTHTHTQLRRCWAFFVSLLIIVPCNFAWCATVVSDLVVSLEHNTKNQSNCRDGYYVLPMIAENTFDQVFNHTCSLNGGYSLYNRNYLIPMHYGVVFSDLGVNLEHNTKNQSDCRDGYYVLPMIAENTFDQVFNHTCSLNGGYSLYNRNYLIPMHYGVVFSDLVVNLEHNAKNQGDCPDNYYNLNLNTTTIIASNNGSCSNGYAIRRNESACRGTNTTTPTCMVMCDSGYIYSDQGTCVDTRCPYSPNVLESAAGNFNIYSNHETTPFLTVKYNMGNCYLKLQEGAVTTNGINIKTNNKTYHIVN